MQVNMIVYIKMTKYIHVETRLKATGNTRHHCCHSDANTVHSEWWVLYAYVLTHGWKETILTTAAYYFVVVNFQRVKLIVDKRRFSSQLDLIRRTTVNLTHGTHFTANVCMTIECQSHLLRFARLQCSIDRRNVKYLHIANWRQWTKAWQVRATKLAKHTHKAQVNKPSRQHIIITQH